uniref:Uncharacterized protein n=1 Tax=Falco tinnunculus TaxID=100819 RepID=A0A8C4UEH7_FALTI
GADLKALSMAPPAAVGSKCPCHQPCLCFASQCPQTAAQAAAGVGTRADTLGTVVVFGSTLCSPPLPAAAAGVPVPSSVPLQLPPFPRQLTCPVSPEVTPYGCEETDLICG